MASDKRKIAFFGSGNLSELEDELYSGKISNDDELIKRANQLDIPIKISDDASKIGSIGDVIKGEVSSKGAFETKRKRIYGTTNGYQMVELIGSEITSRQSGEKAIIIFGNKFAKALAEKLLSQNWKSSLSLKFMGDIFQEIIKEVSKATPSVGGECDVLLKQPVLNKTQAQQNLNRIIDKDVNLLSKFRQKLQNDLIEKSREIELAANVKTSGPVGKVISVDGNMVEVKLNSFTEAYDGNWKKLAGPGDNVIMFSDGSAKVDDDVVVEDENLCLKKDGSSLNCNIILCNLG